MGKHCSRRQDSRDAGVACRCSLLEPRSIPILAGSALSWGHTGVIIALVLCQGNNIEEIQTEDASKSLARAWKRKRLE